VGRDVAVLLTPHISNMDIFFSEEGMVTKGENVVMDSMYHFCYVIDYITYTH